ncbi:MAG TPA: hypothetical protein DCO89_00025 [Clostridiales bacterium]|nr:hypothetical protein [Clostridiales bacterium]
MSYNEMDLNLIKVFLAVYEHRSILLASKKLFISQPAVTKSIKRLEDYLGGKLFIRTPHGVVPTKEGEEFNNACYNSMRILNNGINKFSSLSNLNEGNLNIGSSSTIIRKILLNFIEKFNKKYPNIVISITDANSEKLVRYVKNNVTDLAILNLPIKDVENFHVTPIFETHDCFIASTSFEKDYIDKDSLKNETIIVQKRPSSNRDYFEKMCIENNVEIKPSFEIGSFGLITDFVEKNMGIAYTIKEFVLDDVKNGRIKILNTNFISKSRQIAAITSNVTVNSFACERFIDELKKEFNKN